MLGCGGRGFVSCETTGGKSGSNHPSLCVSQCLVVKAPERSSRYETDSPQSSQVTRPDSKSLDEDGTLSRSCGLSGPWDAFRFTGNLCAAESLDRTRLDGKPERTLEVGKGDERRKMSD